MEQQAISPKILIDLSNTLDRIDRIARIQDLKFNDFQSLSSLYEGGNVGDVLTVNGTRNLMTIRHEDHIQFHTKIKPGQKFPIHWHDCFEVCEVINDGVLSDELRPGLSWKKNKLYIVPPMTRHLPLNQSSIDLELIVNFYRKEKYESIYGEWLKK